MATNNKNFKVVTGLNINNNLVVSGSLSVANPTSSSHVANKGYVDNILSGGLISVNSVAPSSPETGKLWLDTISEKLHLFDGSSWIPMANLSDAQVLQQHIHDTSIDGDGKIVSIFMDAGQAASTAYYLVEAGSPSNTSWDQTWSGGIAIDNFN